MSAPAPKQALGQHWLHDPASLAAIVSAAALSSSDTVLEVGPGLGSLSALLAAQAGRVVAVEADAELAARLPERVTAANLEVITGDIRKFDLRRLPVDYKVVANIPYYLTSQLLRQLLESANPPALSVLLVQQEVAERVTAAPGAMSVLAFSVQYYAEAEIVGRVAKEKFIPVPKVDSAILRLTRRPKPYFAADTKVLFRLVKAGFGERRKQLKNALAGGLRLKPAAAAAMLQAAGIATTARAQELSLEQWQRLQAVYSELHTGP